MWRLSKKLVALSNEQTRLGERMITNDFLGNDIAKIVVKKLRPTDATKFHLHMDNVACVIKLLLNLCGRLAAIENLLNNMDDDKAEKVI